ncbi:MAG: NAD(P) transhydrogenase subunit alpha [Holosporales bacterium]|jgi:NAD(P) transhydrogenase subunit alpha|nr:NAD(P) transhydrogenase subunit alpha [Holosporales bacterium]
MKLFVLKEHEDDSRVSITPDIAKKLLDLGQEVYVEKSAGEMAGFRDTDYETIGCSIVSRKIINTADVVLAVNPISYKEKLKSDAIVISLQEPYFNLEKIKLAKEKNIIIFALDLIPRTTRAQYMDVLSSQSSLAGYKAIVEAAHLLNRGLPLMMTSAGTIPAAKTLVIGAGVAGLQAIATAKRLGAVVSAFDVRASAKEQVESLGAKFIEVESNEKTDGVYAKEMSEAYKKAQEEKLRSVIAQQDIIVTTAQIPGKKAPVIIKVNMISSMKKGAVIIDLASKTGGNCELTRHGEIIENNGVKIVSFDNILNLIAYDASRLFAKNICAFFELLKQEIDKVGSIIQIEDEIIKATLLTCNGTIVNEKFKGE